LIRLSDHAPLAKPVSLGSSDSLKIILTATEDGKAKRPHQAFLLVRDQDTGLETTFPFSVKDTGKAKVELVGLPTIMHQNIADECQKTQKDLPVQLLTSTKPLTATLLLASFGTSQAFSNQVFNLELTFDPNTPRPTYEKPLRYGQLPEIHHIFKSDPKSGPIIISLFFALAVAATVPILLGAVGSDL